MYNKNLYTINENFSIYIGTVPQFNALWPRLRGLGYSFYAVGKVKPLTHVWVFYRGFPYLDIEVKTIQREDGFIDVLDTRYGCIPVNLENWQQVEQDAVDQCSYIMGESYDVTYAPLGHVEKGEHKCVIIAPERKRDRSAFPIAKILFNEPSLQYGYVVQNLNIDTLWNLPHQEYLALTVDKAIDDYELRLIQGESHKYLKWENTKRYERY